MNTVELGTEKFALDRAGRPAMLAALVVGVAGLALAAFGGMSGEAAARTRFFHAYLVAFMFFLSLALGALFFVLMAHLTRAGWSVTVRRVAEVVAASVAVLAVLALPILLWGMDALYPWVTAEHDHLVDLKRPYLNVGFFWLRVVGYFVVWTLIAWLFLGRSRRQDASGDPRLTRTLEVASAPLTIVFALTVTYASFDFLMSLYPHWFSTIFGVYFFAGCFLGFLSFAVLLFMLIQRLGALRRVVSTEHFHDLGKLQFAFVVFWAYIAFSQFMLIWYANLPEETVWYKYRQHGPWMAVSMLLLVGHFIVPFLVMISRHTKRARVVLAAASVWLLVMHWVDLFWLVMPPVYEDRLPVGLPEVATFLGIGGLFLGTVLWGLGRQALVPVRDPRLAEALRFENA